jgi:hypothetical protein
MNKNAIYVAVAVVIIGLLGIGIFLMMKKPAPVTPAPAVMTKTQPEPENTIKTLKELLAAGTPQQCSYSDMTESSSISGTSYISAGKIRGDFTTTAGGKTTAGHMIVIDKTSYIWMDGQTTGFKMAFDPTDVQATASSQKQAVDPNKAMDYKCSSWSVDSAVFVAPTTVKFTDTSAMMAPKAGGAGMTPVNQCATCAALSGDAASQCKAYFKCN